MTQKDYTIFIEELLNNYKDNIFLDSSEIPNIDLYMDQVTTFMDEHLDMFKRNEEDKTLTKTMINNYSKSNLLPPSIKKKYSNDHILLLLLIFYLKPTLSITDIDTLLSPLQKDLINSESPYSLKDFYDALSSAQLESYDDFSEQILKLMELSKNIFPKEVLNKNKDFSIIAGIFTLLMQASMQKNLAISLIDNYIKIKDIPKKKSK